MNEIVIETENKKWINFRDDISDRYRLVYFTTCFTQRTDKPEDKNTKLFR